MKKRAISYVLSASMLAAVMTGSMTEMVMADDIVDIVMPMATLGESPTDLTTVEAKINEITEEKIGVHVIIEPIPFSDLGSQQNLMISSGDQLDLVLSLWEGGIGNYVEKGAVIELTDLVEEYGQDIITSLGPSISGGYYQNALYAVPDGELQGHTYGFYARKDMVEELGFSFDVNSVYTIEDLEELFAAFKETYGEGYYCIAGTTSNSEFFGHLYGHVDNLGGGSSGFPTGGLIECLDKENTTVENIYASEEYMTYAEKMYDWAQKGYYSADAATNTDAGTAQIASGNYLGQFNSTEATTIAQVSSACGTEMVPITMISPYAATNMYQTILWGISSNCETPEKAMELLNLLYSDAEVLTLLMYGIEDEHYVVIEQGEEHKKVVTFPEGIDSMTSPYYVTLGVFGDHYLYPIWSPDTIEGYDLFAEFNEKVADEAQQSVALNYTMSYSDYSAQYSSVSAVVAQYSGAIACGAVNPATQIPAFVKALEDAGINDLITGNQEQLDAFLAAK